MATIGLLAMTIALVGIYGLVSYSISERSREFGVLIALGASVFWSLRRERRRYNAVQTTATGTR